MSRRFTNRLSQLEARRTHSVDHERIARWRAKQERLRECAKEDPEGYTTLLDAHDGVLQAHEEARVRSETTGEDPKDAPEVWEAHWACLRAERRLLGEEAEGPI